MGSPSSAPDEHCTGCGRPSSECRGCAKELDPPRFCPACGRRLRVTVTPGGWRAACTADGTTLDGSGVNG